MTAKRTSWPTSPGGTSGKRIGQGLAADLGPQLGDRQPAGPERPQHPRDAGEVGLGGLDDVDPAVRVVDPVDRHLVDPQAGAFGQDEQLGVEEPAGVLDEGEQALADVGADGLEAALGVGDPGGEGAAQEEVVASGR